MAAAPYVKFGNRLKAFRQKAKESIAEVSGAVEIDAKALVNIEAGKMQPAEDIVLLLISHFSLKEDEALEMCELAGYPRAKASPTNLLADNKGAVQIAYVSGQDARILYTDIVHVNANKYGVVISFLQGLGPNNQPMAVSRIGMSHAHAKSLLEVLQQTLKLAKEHPAKDTDPKD